MPKQAVRRLAYIAFHKYNIPIYTYQNILVRTDVASRHDPIDIQLTFWWSFMEALTYGKQWVTRMVFPLQLNLDWSW